MSSSKFRKSSTHYVAVLIRQAESLGLDVDSILSDTGIPIDLARAEDKWVDNDLLAALAKRMWLETDNETMGFDPAPLRIGTWAIACEFMLAADTLGEVLRRGKRILSYLAPNSIGLDLIVDDHVASLQPKIYAGSADPDHFLVEFLTVVWHRFPSWVIDEKIQLNSAFFSYREPVHGRLYEELFQCDVAFEQDGCGFNFHRRYLEKPVTRTHAELEIWLRNSPADLLYLPGREASVQAHLKGELRKGLKASSAFPAFEAICERLNMSPQVVRRRLSEEDTSYQKIKDAIRCDTAKRLLDNPEISVATVAEQTGFSETAAFSRAFKKWSGLTPVQYRAQTASKASSKPIS
ncbi:MAG: AraC family transcriptional regulator [Halioglobus sp.]